MKEIMLKHIRNGKASIIDIVETFNACLTLNDFSNSDLNAANLASDTSMAEKLMDQGNIIPYLRYFEVLASAKLGE
jgi:hypothetical protein